MCWFQGEKQLEIDPDKKPIIARACIKKWKQMDTEWEIKLLTDDNISEYVPEYNDILNGMDFPRDYPAKSDLLRLLLLKKYGGVWVDATVYPMVPTDYFIDNIINHTGFFGYRFFPRQKYNARQHVEISSWFLACDQPELPIINKWLDLYVKYFTTPGIWWYYTIQQSMCELYDQDDHVKYIIDNMVQIDEKLPHSAYRLGWKKKRRSYVYKSPRIKDIQVNKL